MPARHDDGEKGPECPLKGSRTGERAQYTSGQMLRRLTRHSSRRKPKANRRSSRLSEVVRVSCGNGALLLHVVENQIANLAARGSELLPHYSYFIEAAADRRQHNEERAHLYELTPQPAVYCRGWKALFLMLRIVNCSLKARDEIT